MVGGCAWHFLHGPAPLPATLDRGSHNAVRTDALVLDLGGAGFEPAASSV
jgi:hypothetical protein